MNITIFENTSSLLSSDIFFMVNITLIPNIISLILRLPVNVYILQLIISGNLITSEFYTLNEAIFEVICLYDVVGVVIFVFRNVYLMAIKRFFLGFIVTGRPLLLALICVERYLAVVKPVTFLRLKLLKYKVAMCGIIWLWTLATCVCNLMSEEFQENVVWQIAVCVMVNLYCCIATLLALKRPGPGEGLRQKEGMSNTKLKAFRIILIITVTVFLMYGPLVLVVFLKNYFTEREFLDIVNACYVCTAASGFVQAALFLRRSGKLPFIKWP